jgi:hypothetical protein
MGRVRLPLDRVTSSALREIELGQMNPWSRTPEEQARNSRFLDQLEDGFFEAMSEALAKYRRDDTAR